MRFPRDPVFSWEETTAEQDREEAGMGIVLILLIVIALIVRSCT